MRVFKLVIFTCFLMISIPSFADNGEAVVTFEINNIEEEVGNIMISICKNEREFRGDISPAYSFFFPAKKKQTLAKITIPKGKYAIKIYHDENENKTLDLNQRKHPIEKFGFSNNYLGAYGQLPPFNKVLVDLNKDENFLRINLR